MSAETDITETEEEKFDKLSKEITGLVGTLWALYNGGDFVCELVVRQGEFGLLSSRRLLGDEEGSVIRDVMNNKKGKRKVLSSQEEPSSYVG